MKDSPASRNCSRPRFDPWVRRSPGGGHRGPLLTLAWRSSWTEESGSLQPIRSQNSDTLQATQHTHVRIIIGTITFEAPAKALHTAPQVSAYPAVSQRARVCPSSPYFPRGIAALILEFLRASPSEHLPFPNSPSPLAVGTCDE